MKLKTLAAVAALAATVALGARVAQAFLGGVVVNQSYAVSQVVPISLGSGVTNLGVVVNYSSPAFSAATFTTGQVSTGSITIADNTKLSTAAATSSVVVASTSGALGDYVSISCPVGKGAVLAKVNRDWIYGPSVSSAAINLAAALTARGACLGGVTFTPSGGTVSMLAPVGALYDGVTVVAHSSNATMSVSSPTFVGGRSSAIVSVNGYQFQANKDFTVGGSSATSATNLAAAINANAGLSPFLTATAGTGANVGIVTLQSKAPGTLYNFPLATSNSAAVSVFGPALYGGANESWSLGGTTINLPSHGFVTGLPVLYSTGSGSPAISGLTNQTTYYVGVVDANDVALATTNARAAAGLFVALASSSTLTAAKTYSLAPLAFSAGSAGFSWQVGSSKTGPWTNLAGVSSVTYTSPGTAVWSFGALPYPYLGLNVTAPSQGAMTLNVSAQGQ